MDQENDIRTRINLETSKIPWKELQRFFAAGKVLAVDPVLDLVEVALRINQDNQSEVSKWKNDGYVEGVTDEQAREWLKTDASVWAVVVKPWILVQSIEKTSSSLNTFNQ